MPAHYTDVSIVNTALAKVGEAPISSLDDQTSVASTIKILYEQKRDKLLREHPWNFAKARLLLALSANKPAFGYDNMFIIPDDCLRVLEISCNSEHSKEGRYILTNAREVGLLYVKRETDANVYDASFVDLLSLGLAVDLAWALKGSRTLRDDLRTEFINELRLARGYSATESTPKSNMEYGDGIVVTAAKAGHKISRY